MVVTLFGIEMLVKPELWNAEVLIVVTLFGIVTLVKLEQPLNALSPILVNKALVGKVTLARLEQR
jgi:hypothetical protein